jgi:3-hydroxy-3-methylglutaryl CoA synthase
MMDVGIEKIGVDPLTAYLPMRALCEARGTDPKHVEETMMVDGRGVAPVWEDSVTTGVNAARSVLTQQDRDAIELLVVASESSVDEEKSLATWVHRYLELSPRCRSFEAKAACYAGPGAMMMALYWLCHPGTRPDAKALVVMTDLSRAHLGKPYEYALGGAGTAILLSRRPRALRVRLGASVCCTLEREDLIRPDPHVEVGDTELSLISYLEALDECLDARDELLGTPHPLEDARWNIYHAPFGGMTFLAHKALLSRYGSFDRAAARRSFDERSAPALTYLRRMGTTYSSSTYLGMLGLFADPRVEEGDGVSVFAYGAGSQAELYFGEVGAEHRAVLAESRIGERIAAREVLTVAAYESIERARRELGRPADVDLRAMFESDPLYAAAYRDRGRLVLERIEGYQRRYAWS